MGTTIRRQPVSFPIPASPDYKFLNITDFGGLNISSNPFVVSSNTASDCLNVYVDEDNALSTRPRLQLKYDLMSLAGLDDSYQLIDVYNLHDGYLLHAKKDDNGYMYRFEEKDGVLKNPVTITGEKPVEKCKIFEHSEIIYLLTGNGYKQLSENHISDVDEYIPKVVIGKHKRTDITNADGSISTSYTLDGVSFESLNLANTKYKETYFWDGLWDLSSLQGSNVVEIINNYIKTSDFDFEDTFIPIKPYRLSDENPEFVRILCKNTTDLSQLYSIQINVYTGEMVSTEPLGKPNTIPTSYKDIVGDVSSDGQVLVYGYTNSNGVYIKRNGSWSSSIIYSNYTFYHSLDFPTLALTPDGKTCVIGCGTEIVIRMYTDTGYSDKGFSVPDYCRRVQISDDGETMVFGTGDLQGLNPGYYTGLYLVRNALTSESRETKYLEVTYSDLWGPFALSNSGNYLLTTKAYTSDITFYPEFKLNETTKTLKDLPDLKNGVFFFSSTEDKLFVSGAAKNGWYHLSQQIFTPLELSLETIRTAYSTQLNNYLFLPNTNGYRVITLNLDSTEALLEVVREISPLDSNVQDTYTDWFEKRLTFNNAKLIERFDNNIWFASKNHTFHTLYNNPTYIPLSSYNDLGEDFEEITGLSIVNDNVLAAYKRNRIYIITPVTVGNQETYSYTETKNVVGNDVPDAPILTILTEMPTIVSYDGIFALNQLENVQSSDRITTLISENINPRWLKESTQDIDNCKTLNRLYWTYYILPHKRAGDENKDYTKIYLLDNRTQQWYYWELPIYIINAMVKDNKTHFVNEDGTIFALEITDLIHEYNPDVTEYYDKVNDEKLIIPWHWTSQILSLSTINYSKKLVDTTFILTDTDTQDEYGLDYSFKAWRKSVSETNATTISNNIHYVQSTTKRTMIPRFNFIQIKLSNTAEDLDNNKLRLVGLGLKYVLLEGLY